MFEVSILNTVIFGTGLIVLCYAFFCIWAREIIRPNCRALIYYIVLFSLFGVVGEHFTNTLYEHLFGVPLWEYHLYPAHNGNITYFFPFVWGTLGFYTYFRDHIWRRGRMSNSLRSGLILGMEAIVIELIVNIPFFLLFGSFIFYYLPATLGPLSHFSTIHVVPFYMIVGYVTGRLIAQQERVQYRGLRTTLALYLMIIITFVYL